MKKGPESGPFAEGKRPACAGLGALGPRLREDDRDPYFFAGALAAGVLAAGAAALAAGLAGSLPPLAAGAALASAAGAAAAASGAASAADSSAAVVTTDTITGFGLP